MKPPIEQLALIAAIAAIGLAAAVLGQWQVASVALGGCVGALNLQSRGPSGPQQP